MSTPLDAPAFEDKVKGLVQMESYAHTAMDLEGWDVQQTLDDIVMVQFVDINEDGTMVKRGSMFVPIAAAPQVWRVGRVILKGPNCKYVKVGDNVIFPNDKGIQVREMNGLKNIAFLNEQRLFGTCKARAAFVPPIISVAKKTKSSKKVSLAD